MAIAVVLVVLVLASVLFHLFTPWWLPPLASNWKTMDDTLQITVIITGLFFVVISLFVAYTLWRFRHREGSRAAYQPDNHRLERRLIILTSVGRQLTLAPVPLDIEAVPDEGLLFPTPPPEGVEHGRDDRPMS